MLYKHVTTVGLALALLGLASTLALAQDSDTPPSSTGVVATITAVDARATPSQPEPGAAPAGRRALAVPVEMTCTQQQESLPRKAPSGGHVVDTTCIAAKGPDGQEVAVRVSDSRVGHKLHCAEKEGKITCPDVRIPAFETPTGVTR